MVKEVYEALVSHPKKTRYIAEARIKSDRVDSKALSELVRLLPAVELHASLRDRWTSGESESKSLPVRERMKQIVKIMGVLAYEGIKPPRGFGLFTRRGVE